MWMMGYTSDGGDFNTNIQDSFTGRRLRPLVPRTATATAAASTNPPYFFHGSDIFALNHHFAAMVEQNKREINTQQVVVSSRWNPTPEQLQALEDLYRRGTRTPSAEQIQHITAELRRYGKIEGKNVFYWFQNHKARERQKRRRQLDSPSDEQLQNHINLNGQEKESLEGANRTIHEVEQAKYWASPTNSSTIPAEKALSRQGASKAATVEAESKADGWVQFDDTDDAAADHLQQQQRKNATWQMMHNLSSSHYPTNLINSSSAPTSATIPSPLIAKPSFVNISFLDKPYFHIADQLWSGSSDGRGVEAQTLQLFPILGEHGRDYVNGDHGHEKEEGFGAEMINSSNGTNGYQFFEFLPLKN